MLKIHTRASFQKKTLFSKINPKKVYIYILICFCAVVTFWLWFQFHPDGQKSSVFSVRDQIACRHSRFCSFGGFPWTWRRGFICSSNPASLWYKDLNPSNLLVNLLKQFISKCINPWPTKLYVFNATLFDCTFHSFVLFCIPTLYKNILIKINKHICVFQL